MKISEIIKKGSLISLLVFLFFVPFSFTATNVFLFIFYAGVVCNKDLYNISNIKKISAGEKSFVCFSIAYYLLCLISLLWSDDLDRGLHLVGRYVSVMLFPIFFLLGKAGGIIKKVRPLCFAFIVGVFVSSIVCLILSYQDCWHDTPDGMVFNFDIWNRDITSYDAFISENCSFRYNLLSHFIHPSYYSLYILFSMILLFYFAYYEKKISFKILLAVIIVYFLVFTLLLESRAGLLALFVSFVLAIIFWSIIWGKKYKFMILLLLLFAVIISFVIPQTRLNGIVEESLNEFKENYKNEKHEDLIGNKYIRILIWKNAVRAIKEQPILGAGVGDAENVLYQKMKEDNLDLDLGTHNQYLNSQLSTGILGLLILLGMFCLPLYYGIKSRFFPLITFTLAVMINLLFENMISRYAGIMFIPWAMMVLLMMSEEKNNVLEK